MLPSATAITISGIPIWTDSNRIKLGLSYGNQGWAMPDVLAFDNWCGRKVSLVTIFTTLDNPNLATQINKVKAVGKIPLVTIEPWFGLDPTTNSHVIDGHMARITSGEFDNQIKTIAPLLIGCWVRFGHEPNGNWYPWCQNPADYVPAWRHFVSFLSSTVKRVFCVNNGDVVGGAKAEQFYPGDDYVDILAVDGYNWDTKTPAQVFDSMIARLRMLSALPLAITEAGCREYVGKVKFIADLMQYAIDQVLTAVSYFNQDRPPNIWSFFGGSVGDSIYTTAVAKYKNYLQCATSIFRLDPS